jgi:hypothetical protein
VKTEFIRKHQPKLADIDLSSSVEFEEGNFLLVCIPYRKINYKRRRSFNELAIFRAYRGGNVLVKLCTPHIKFKNDRIKCPLYILPI